MKSGGVKARAGNGEVIKAPDHQIISDGLEPLNNGERIIKPVETAGVVSSPLFFID